MINWIQTKRNMLFIEMPFKCTFVQSDHHGDSTDSFFHLEQVIRNHSWFCGHFIVFANAIVFRQTDKTEEMMLANQKSNHLTLSKRLDESQQMTAHGDVDWMNCARVRTVEDSFVNRKERMVFKRRTGENFIVQTFSGIDRMRQSNEGKHETSVIGAIETFPDDLSKPFLLYSNNSKEKSPREEGDQNILSKSSVGKPTEKQLNSQTDCWLNDVSERRVNNGISPSERENHLLSFLHRNDGRWHEKHNLICLLEP